MPLVGSAEVFTLPTGMQFFTLDSSKMEVFKTYFFDVATTQNDHPCYVKHVFGRIWVFFTLFGY